MADFGIYYEIEGVPQIEHRLLGIQDRAINAYPALQAIAEDMRAMEFALFQTEGHGEWAPLATSTLESKAEEGYPTMILQATEWLMDSLTSYSAGGAHVERVTEDEVLYGTTAPYAKYHQYGTRYMPARPPVDFTEADLMRWTKIIQAYVFGMDALEVQAAGGGGIPWGLASNDPFGLSL